LAVTVSLIIISISLSFGDIPVVDITPKHLSELKFTKTVDVDRKQIFHTMTDIPNYPIILPKNFISVDILEKNENSIIAKEKIIERGIELSFIVKHSFIPFEKHEIEILEGDAKGTKIIQLFSDDDSSTLIDTSVEFHLSGALQIFSFFPKTSVIHALDTVTKQFVLYSQGFETESQHAVDQLYREILQRPADIEGLNHYSSLIDKNEISIDELKQILLQSDESKKLLLHSEKKSLDELSETTIIIIDEIYLDILQRKADSLGLTHFGSLLESNKITTDEIRDSVYNSKEALTLRLDTVTKTVIDDYFFSILERHATENELNYYEEQIRSKQITSDDLREILLSKVEITD